MANAPENFSHASKTPAEASNEAASRAATVPEETASLGNQPAALLVDTVPGVQPSSNPPPHARWLCPMCLGVESDRPGNCPKCGLALDPSTLPLDADSDDPELRSMTWRLWFALALAIPLVGISMEALLLDNSPVSDFLGSKGYVGLQFALCTPIVLIAGWPILARAWRSIRTLRPNIFTLTGLGIGAAYLFSLVVVVFVFMDLPLLPSATRTKAQPRQVVAQSLEVLAPSRPRTFDPFFDAAAVIVVLTVLGQVLELRARSRTGAAIRKLVRLAPRTAQVMLPDGREELRPLDAVKPGDLVRVRTGERIPVDGVVREGFTTVDESLLTGEPMRVGKGPGMHVTAGTENGLGVVTIEAQRVQSDTVLGHMITLIEQAQRSRVPLQRTVDRIAAWFIPIVVLIASATYAGWSLYGPPGSLTTAAACAIGVLVAACPVALGLATPTAVVVGMSRAARSGILFRDGAALERLASVNAVLFDKTGTLTEGRMKLIATIPNVGISADEFIALAAAIERGSEHPIGLAIVWEAVRRGLNIPVAEQVETFPGLGVRGLVGGRRVVVGQFGFLQQSGAHREPMVSEARSHREAGHSVVFVGRDNQCIGVVVMNDPLRPNVKAAVSTLRAAGLRLILLTGDHASTSRGLAQQAGIEEVIADTLPIEKYAVVQKLKNEGLEVAMCGDGINDAPALAAADVGIAMGTGTEASITIARVALVHPDLRSIATAREISRATVRTIRQNMFLAFLYTIVAIPLAAGILFPIGGGLVSPIWNALGMSVSSLAIVGNSLRLGRSR